jgi:hypothetical protein
MLIVAIVQFVVAILIFTNQKWIQDQVRELYRVYFETEIKHQSALELIQTLVDVVGCTLQNCAKLMMERVWNNFFYFALGYIITAPIALMVGALAYSIT